VDGNDELPDGRLHNVSSGPSNSPFDSDQHTTQPPAAAPGWYSDPTRRFEFRYFNGSRWTADVSVHGNRQIDNGGPISPQPAAYLTSWGPAAPIDRPPGRGFAIASFVLALASIVIGWIPFLFVIAVGAAITALVFAVIGIRRARAAGGRGMGFAVTGAILTPIALGVCVVGFWFTRVVMEEVGEFVDPGTYQLAEDQPCTVVDGVATLTGTITNRDRRTRSYTLTVAFTDNSPGSSPRRIDTDTVNVDELAPGATASWEAVRLVGDANLVACEVTAVYGPAPFGLDEQRVDSP
jgi:hypothetical protein